MDPILNYINGEYVTPSSNDYIDVIDPAIGEKYTEVANSDKNDIDKFINFMSINKNKNLSLDLLRKFLSESNEIYSKKSILRIISNLKSFFDYLVKNSFLENNLFNEINNPKIEKKITQYCYYKRD